MPKQRTNVGVPAEIHKGLTAKGYNVAGLTRALLAEFLATNNISEAVQAVNNQDHQAAA